MTHPYTYINITATGLTGRLNCLVMPILLSEMLLISGAVVLISITNQLCLSICTHALGVSRKTQSFFFIVEV